MQDQRPINSHFKTPEDHAKAKAEYLARNAEKRQRRVRNNRRYFDGELRGLRPLVTEG